MSGAPAARLLRFRIGAAAAALPLAIVRAVVTLPAIAPVPGGRPALAGVALARGLALPVYDLRVLFRAGAASPADGIADSAPEHLIVCDWGEVSVGLLGERPDLLDGATQPGDPGEAGPFDGPCAAGRLMQDGELVTVLDAARLFASLGVPEDGSTDAREAEGEDDPAGR